MGGTLPEPAEVGGGADDAAAEVVHPEAVDDHAAEERMAPGGEPPRPGEAAAARGQRRIISRNRRLPLGAGHLEVGGANLSLRLPVVAAVEDARDGEMAGRLLENVKEILDRLPGPDRRDLFSQGLELVSGRLVVLVEHAGGDVDARPLLEELLLLWRAVLLGGPGCDAELLAELLRVLEQLLLERGSDRRGLLRLELLRSCHRLGFDLRRAGPIGIREQRHEPFVRRFPRLRVEGRLEEGAEGVVIGLRDRIVAMVVALGTADGEPEE